MDAQLISSAFDLGAVDGELTPVQHTVSRTWRLNTGTGSYLVKELWPAEAPFWADWLSFGVQHQRAWADPAADALGDILRLTEVLTTAYEQAPDRVITHGDFMPSNVIYGMPGPVLIDWDSVGAESALHETGDTLYHFTDGDVTRLRETVKAYLDATGSEVGARHAELFDKTIGTRLAGLTELLIADAAGGEVTGWKAKIGDREERVASEFRALPSFVQDLRRLSRSILSG
ncbi:phosphotransferase [Streptomyces sp. SID13031]|uniref:phosphotransferase n=1 Tax=Streptomyces sp. SID13031 TaxID=2706046 RepID=UPI0013CB5AA6|nr:phosphotransferase [Streptomyces sp. SID13031]NEA33727.1 phosphotransferase [Streptomyces sp. SID13031]